MQKVFGDMEGINNINIMEEFFLDEEDELLFEDWKDFGLDDEFVEMVMDEFILVEIDDLQDEFIDNMLKDILFLVLNVLMNLSFDVVL